MDASAPEEKTLGAALSLSGNTAPHKIAEALSLLLPLLPLDARARVACVCRAWRAAAAHPVLWEELSFKRCAAHVTDVALASLCARAGAGLRALHLDAASCWSVTGAGVLAALHGCTGVRHLGMSKQLSLSARQAQQLAAACPALQHADCKITCTLAEAAVASTALPGPLTLKCGNCGVEAGMAQLAECLRDSTSLTALNLSSDIGAEGATQLADSLRTNTTLTSALLMCRIGDVGAAQLADCLRTNTTLTTLGLNFGQFGAAGAARLGECLRVNTTLRWLHFGMIPIGDAGATQLAEGLRVNGTLTTLTMISNEVGNEGATHLAECLRGNAGLKTLHMKGNAIGDAGAAQLAACLRVNTSLTNLDLCGNRVGIIGAMQLAESLRTNTTLKTFALESNDIGAAGTQALQQACPPTCTLRL